MMLADRLEVVILERGPRPACELAAAVRRRKATVLEALRREPQFVQSGRRRASRWSVVSRPVFDADVFVRLHPSWRRAEADEVVEWLPLASPSLSWRR